MIHNSIFQAICRVGIFMICAQAIVHFRPNESYEKYLKLLMSIMVLIQLFAPVCSFFFGGGSLKAAELMERFEKDLAAGIQEAEKNAQEADRLLEQMTLEEVRRRVEEAKEDAGAAMQGEETAGTTGGAVGKPGTVEKSGAADKSGSESSKGETGTADRDEIRIELEGIEPIKIGQEE